MTIAGCAAGGIMNNVPIYSVLTLSLDDDLADWQLIEDIRVRAMNYFM